MSVSELNIIPPSKCPTCNSPKRIKSGKENGLQRYKCKNCGRNYRETNQTTLYWMHKKELVHKYLDCMLKGYSLRKAAKETGISLATAFAWRHRFLKELNPQPNYSNSRSVVSTFETEYSEKGTRRFSAKQHRQKVVSLFKCDAIGLSSLKVLLPKKKHSTVSLLQYATAEFRTKRKYLPKVLKCSSQRCTVQDLLVAETSVVAELQCWLNKFRGVATKYLQNYWRWFEFMREIEVANHPLKLFANRCFS